MTLYVEGNDNGQEEEDSTSIPTLEVNQEVTTNGFTFLHSG